MAVPQQATQSAIEAVWRIESAKLIGALTRMVRDVGLAEDLAQEALVTALEKWPSAGIPDRPGAWLMATAKNRAVDQLRRRQMLDRKHGLLEDEARAEGEVRADLDAALDEYVADDVLRLMFIACHPVLSTEARVALTLRLVAGLTTEEIARAFVVPAPTIAQRIVRAKRTLTEARVPFEVPEASELGTRLGSVLEVIYLVFNEGYSATAGDDWMRPELWAASRRPKPSSCEQPLSHRTIGREPSSSLGPGRVVVPMQILSRTEADARPSRLSKSGLARDHLKHGTRPVVVAALVHLADPLFGVDEI